MRAIGIIILMVFCVGSISAQNLIQNGNFKDTIVGNFNIIYATFWNTPSLGSPDFIHPSTKDPFKAPANIGGFQYAKSAKGYYGVSLFSKNRSNAREYIQNELVRPLMKDSLYCIQFYLSLADSMNYTLKNKLGVYFSNLELDYQIPTTLPITPQIQFDDSNYFTEKEKWVKISATYTASGGEKYLIIGHFEDDLNIDTLRVMGGNKIEHTNVYYYLDDFWLSHCDSVIGLPEIKLKNQISIYPNPVKDQLFVRYEGNQKLQIKLYNLVGQAVEIYRQEQVDQLQLLLGHLPKGIYFLDISTPLDVTNKRQRIIKKIIKR